MTSEELDEDPWIAVSAENLRAKLETTFVPASGVTVESGCVLFPRRHISIVGILLDLVSKNKEERERHQEKLGELGEMDVFTRFLQERPSWLVKCSNPTSMVSGVWGLCKFTMGRRGYVYFDSTEDLGEEYNSLPILAAWEPVEDKEAFKACFLATYEQEWDNICLPPKLGECASGPSHLIRQAMFRILEAQPDAWEQVLDTLSMVIEKDVLTPAVLEGIADDAKVPYETLTSALRRVFETDPQHLTSDERRAVIAAFWECIEWDPFPPMSI